MLLQQFVMAHSSQLMFSAGEHLLSSLFFDLFSNAHQTSPHVINAVMEAIGGIRVSLGCHRVLSYVLQGLFHPARKVREVYWKIYNTLYIGGQVIMRFASLSIFFFFQFCLHSCLPLIINDEF